MDADMRLLFLALPPMYHDSKSFPIVFVLVFAPLPLFELGFILRLPIKLLQIVLKAAPMSTFIHIMVA